MDFALIHSFLLKSRKFNGVFSRCKVPNAYHQKEDNILQLPAFFLFARDSNSLWAVLIL